jgi:hypothetical protein
MTVPPTVAVVRDIPVTFVREFHDAEAKPNGKFVLHKYE